MPSYVLRPDVTGTNSWAINLPALNVADALDDAVTQPTAPSTTGDSVSTNTANAVCESNVGGFTLAAGEVVESVTLWIYCSTGAKRAIDFDIYTVGPTKLTTTVRVDAALGNGWRSVTYTGSLTQAQLDALYLRMLCASTAGGGGAGTVTAYAAYMVVVAAVPVPNTTITSGPTEGSTINDATPTFEFTSDIAGATFQAQVNNGGWNTVTSPYTTTTLPEGGNTVEIRAVNGATPDPSPATRTFTVNAVPETTITAGPAEGSTIGDTTPTFEFTSDIAGSTFEAEIDNSGTWTTVTSPYTTSALSEAQHTVRIRAVFAGVPDATPESRTFTVAVPTDTTPPLPNVGAPSLPRISRQPGKDSTDIPVTTDEQVDAYEARIAPTTDATRAQGVLLKSASIAATSSFIVSITDDDIIAAEGAVIEGDKIIKVFVKDIAGNWSEAGSVLLQGDTLLNSGTLLSAEGKD